MKCFAKTYQFAYLIIFNLLLTHAAYGVEVKGIDIAENITQPESGQSLVLNGTGIRTRFFFDIYIGALYLSDKSSDAKAILGSPAPKRVSMHFLRDKIEKERLTDGWNDAFSEILNEDTYKALKSDIEQFNSYFPDIVKGDTVVIDFVPSLGTVISINEQRKGIIPGDSFQRALLSIWLGGLPPNKALKEGMLGIVKE